MSDENGVAPTSRTKQPFGMVLIAGVLLLGIFASMAFLMPYYSQLYFYFSLAIWAFGVIAFVWVNLKPNIWPKFLFYLSLASLFTIIAVRTFNYLLPTLKGLVSVLIISTVVFAHTLPLWNTEVTRLLRNELSFAPKTRAGKLLLRSSLALFPTAGLIGAIIGLFMQNEINKLDIRLFVLGPLCWYLAIILPFSTHTPTSPWE
jgi:hypothetical protein